MSIDIKLGKKRSNADSAWKEILDVFFKDCLDYCLPHLSSMINWQKGWVSLDKELAQITKGAKAGKNLVDKLFKVYLKNGKEQWILFHTEVQGKKEDNFSERMFIYAYRIYDKYKKPVISAAILTDENRNWRPNTFELQLIPESYLKSGFAVIKILDFELQVKELEAATNPFASVIYTQLLAILNKKQSEPERKDLKLALTRRLFDKGYTKEEIINLYKFLDWLICLPESLELEYNNDIHELEEAKKMPYISSAEKIGMKRGLEKGLEKFAEFLFKKGEPLKIVQKETDLPMEKLLAIQTKFKAKPKRKKA